MLTVLNCKMFLHVPLVLPQPLQKAYALLQQIHTRPEHVLNPSFVDGVSSSPHKQADKINKTNVIFDGEQPLEAKASFTSLDSKLLCIEKY